MLILYEFSYPKMPTANSHTYRYLNQHTRYVDSIGRGPTNLPLPGHPATQEVGEDVDESLQHVRVLAHQNRLERLARIADLRA